jgi:hypothetical protein
MRNGSDVHLTSSIINKTLEQEENNVLDITINRCNVKSEWEFRISLYVVNPELQIVLLCAHIHFNISYLAKF